MKKITLSTICLLFIFSLNSFSQTWNALTSGTSTSLLAVSAINKDTCYVAGFSGKVMKTTNGGLNWTTQTTPTTQDLYGMDFINGSTGFAAGSSGALIKTINGGATWTSVSATSTSLRSVRFINPTTGFITGDAGLILRTINGGSTWTTSTTGTSQGIYAVWFISSTTGFVSCLNGTILKTTDGGSNWTLNPTTGVTTQINTIHFTSATTGTFVGANGVIKRTTNGGATWSAVTMTPTSDFLHGHTFVDANTGFVTGGNIGSNTGIILTTMDGGLNWTTSLPGTSRLANLDFVNANVGYAVGLNGTILKYTSNVGILENENKPGLLLAYPNPTSNVSSIDISGLNLTGTINLELFDLSGKLIRKIQFENTNILTIEKGSLNSGTYIFNVSSNNKLGGTGRILID